MTTNTYFKLSYGPAFNVGLCWLLWAFVGCVLAAVGMCWPALAFVGLRWRGWLLWAFAVLRG